MDKVNVLLIGNSGVGKSTLINAVLENKVAKTSIGERGTVKMDVYESDSVPFRLIDSKGMEYSFFENFKLKSELKKWTKTSLGNEDYEKCISMIWYCVDGTSKRLMKENLKILNSITKFFKSVPVIIVITKSYSQPERKENIEMIFIDELLSDIIEEYNLTPYDKKIEFVLDSPDDVKLYGDYNKINILFFNIYKNAIEAIKNKGIIKTTVTPDIGKTTITIEDNGGGISPVVLNNLGTPFVTTKENGSGLGILICKNIVHEHKGKIDFENTDNGCVVTVELPNYLFSNFKTN